MRESDTRIDTTAPASASQPAQSGSTWTGVVGIFARADHPPGWGYPPAEGEHSGRAHGYVTLFVECADDAELRRVAAVLARGYHGIAEVTYFDGALSPNGHDWFGGRFEFIAKAPAVSLPAGRGRFDCRGDNRMVAYYTADEVFNP